MSPQTHRARKRFGQNFLQDPHVIDRIIHAVNPKPDQHVIEIGPGLGAITAHLLEAAQQLDAVELDRDLIEKLKQRFAAHENFHIHNSDALKFEFCKLANPDEKLRIVGNLPYNISTPLLFHLMSQLSCIQDIHCMLQKEVVLRLAAAPGENNYGRLSVMMQYHCDIDYLFDVAPDAFDPAPKVDSAVARLIPHTTPPVNVNNKDTFAKVVSQAFSQRRKTLRNCLKTLLTADQITALGIDPSIRPERLTLEDFATLSNAIELTATDNKI